MDIPPQLLQSYFFSGAGAGALAGSAGFSGAGAAFSGAGGGGGAVFASSFAAGGFCSADGPQPTSAKLAKNEIAINNTNSFFMSFTSFLL
jgi:hypothetical protein